ncbi:hypothetical protein [Deinococcus ruber]|uniref:hypothetical protein n=1 Tax=Deinococcus ruber TaxID=1848197 RepID=UPI00166B3702|nr:hypothetical protein [Deinococcus ruber]
MSSTSPSGKVFIGVLLLAGVLYIFWNHFAASFTINDLYGRWDCSEKTFQGVRTVPGFIFSPDGTYQEFVIVKGKMTDKTQGNYKFNNSDSEIDIERGGVLFAYKILSKDSFSYEIDDTCVKS